MAKINDESLNFLNYLKKDIIDIDDYALLFTIKKDKYSSLEENIEKEEEYFNSFNKLTNKERLIFVLEIAHRRIINEFSNFSFDHKLKTSNSFTEVIGFISDTYKKIEDISEDELSKKEVFELYKYKISLRLFEYGPKNYTCFSTVYQKYYNEFISLLDQKLLEKETFDDVYSRKNA